MKIYDPNKHYRSSSNFTTCYTELPKGKVILSVGTYGLEGIFRNPDGDGRTFNSLEEARQFALNKGYLVEYDPKEELKKALEMQNKMNKTKQPNV